MVFFFVITFYSFGNHYSEYGHRFSMNVKIILIFSFLSYIYADDPCIDFTPIDDWERSLANEDSSTLLCDSFLTEGWYKSVSNAGNEIPTECPLGGFRCGTAKSIWINGSHPTTNEITNVTACVSDYTGCCIKTYDIQVKKCTGYYVYHLYPTEGCAQAYCFGTELPCPTGYSSKNGFTPGCKYDPCLPENYKEIDQWSRSVQNNNSDTWICDSFLEAGWYRSVSKAGHAMPTQCPQSGYTCGTAKPIWLNGVHPQNDEIANLTACASSLGNCCSHTYDIQVKNCSTFNVYNLVPTNGCPQAYCFGFEIQCQEGYTSDTGFTPGCELDPCNSVNYAILKDEVKRSSNYTLQASDEPINDSKLDRGWYRVESATGNDIVTIKQTVNSCGTKYPIWMKGALPSVHDKTVTRQVCLTGDDGNCQSEFPIKVRNCGTFRTYLLETVHFQFAGYCFGTFPVATSSSSKESKSDRRNFISIVIPISVVAVMTVAIIACIIHKKCLKKVDVMYKEKHANQSLPHLNTDFFVLETNSKPGLHTSLYSSGFFKA